ncbi:MAG: SdiA-regulated domain-containing protein [Pseudomonadota bacterium]
MIRTWPLLLTLLAACTPSESDDAARYLELPEALTEISGLAAASPHSVFAHDDERGTVYEVSIEDGRIMRSFAIGNPVIRDDIEGIAADGNRLWVINSEGMIRSFDAGRDRTRVLHRQYDTGVGEYCEVEGLSLSPEPDMLLIACKNMRQGDRRGTLIIYEWNIRTHEPVGRPWRQIPLAEALRNERTEFAPSGIEWLPDFGQILVISARGRSMLILDEDGRIVARHRLNANRHPQSEGVTVIGSNRLVIADEGQQGGPGRIAIYPFPLT